MINELMVEINCAISFQGFKPLLLLLYEIMTLDFIEYIRQCYVGRKIMNKNIVILKCTMDKHLVNYYL